MNLIQVRGMQIPTSNLPLVSHDLWKMPAHIAILTNPGTQNCVLMKYLASGPLEPPSQVELLGYVGAASAQREFI